jgi:hypothetical protein
MFSSDTCMQAVNLSFGKTVPSYSKHKTKKKKLNSVALIRERTIPTEQLPLAGEVLVTFAQRIPMAVFWVF